jgi:hypothetical protein
VARLAAFLFFAIAILSCAASAQNPPASDPQAVAYAAQSITAMTGSTTISDVTLTGSVTWNGASTDTGTLTMKALGTGESRMDLALSSGTRTEIRDASSGSPQGEWIADGTSTPFALHNCWTDAAWFFPALSGMATAQNSNIVLNYLGLGSWQGSSAQHLQAYLYLSGQSSKTTASVQGLSTVDYYLDPNSFLPMAITFNAHPDGDANTNLSVQVLFLSYQSFNGVQVPVHVQKYFNGQLLVDMSITSAVFNSGLQLSDFSLQ